MLRPNIGNRPRRLIENREPKHRRQLINKIISLCQDPRPVDSHILRGTELDERRVTIGDYRIIYWVQPSTDHISRGTLYVDAVGKRSDDEVYRRFNKH